MQKIVKILQWMLIFSLCTCTTGPHVVTHDAEEPVHLRTFKAGSYEMLYATFVESLREDGWQLRTADARREVVTAFIPSDKTHKFWTTDFGKRVGYQPGTSLELSVSFLRLPSGLRARMSLQSVGRYYVWGQQGKEVDDDMYYKSLFEKVNGKMYPKAVAEPVVPAPVVPTEPARDKASIPAAPEKEVVDEKPKPAPEPEKPNDRAAASAPAEVAPAEKPAEQSSAAESESYESGRSSETSSADETTSGQE